MSSKLSQEIAKYQRHYSVFTHDEEGKVLSITIPTSTSTVSDAIQIAVAEFKRSHLLELTNDAERYKLYAANNNGTRVKEFPSLDEEQELLLINLGQFYLRQRNNKHSKPKKVR